MKMLRVDADHEVGEMGRGLGKAVPKLVPFEPTKRAPEGLPKGVTEGEDGKWTYGPGKQEGAMASSAALVPTPVEAPSLRSVGRGFLRVGDWVRRKESFRMLVGDPLEGGKSGQVTRITVEDKMTMVWVGHYPCCGYSVEFSPRQFSEECLG